MSYVSLLFLHDWRVGREAARSCPYVVLVSVKACAMSNVQSRLKLRLVETKIAIRLDLARKCHAKRVFDDFGTGKHAGHNRHCSAGTTNLAGAISETACSGSL